MDPDGDLGSEMVVLMQDYEQLKKKEDLTKSIVDAHARECKKLEEAKVVCRCVSHVICSRSGVRDYISLCAFICLFTYLFIFFFSFLGRK